MFADIGQCDSIEKAAVIAAGNWEKWRNFVWFGSSDYPKSNEIMLSYLTGPQSGITDFANAQVVNDALAPFKGMLEDPTKCADDYGASFCGDMNALSGYMVRVYDESHNITPAFAVLYALAKKHEEHPILDRKVYDQVNKSTMHRYLHAELEWRCEQKKIVISTDNFALMVESVLSIFLEETEFSFDDFEYDDIDKYFKGWLRQNKSKYKKTKAAS